MLTVNIHEAKTRLSELIARAVKGEAFIIAKAGTPLVKVAALDAPEPRKMQRIGFAQGRWITPEEGFPEDLPPEEQEELERCVYGDAAFPPQAGDDVEPR